MSGLALFLTQPLTTETPVTTTSTEATLAGKQETKDKMNLTPIVVPLVVLILLAPVVGCAVYLCRKRWRARKKSLKAENVSWTFSMLSGYESTLFLYISYNVRASVVVFEYSIMAFHCIVISWMSDSFILT